MNRGFFSRLLELTVAFLHPVFSLIHVVAVPLNSCLGL